VKQRFVTNRRHQAVVLSAFGTLLLPYLDGEHDFSFFENLLIQEIKSGKLTMLDANKNIIQKDDDLKKLATVFCQKELEHFAHQALLISSIH
jgi:methyltransferase-like protein